MARVILENITKSFGDQTAVKNFNLIVEDKEFVILVGPSGCGKSTALRMIAGLEEPTSGKITIGDRVVNDLPPRARDIAMVFQEYALYPHMSVFNNLAFGLKLKKTQKNKIERRVKDTAKILGIEELLERKPKQLSGGQRQRVAVGRAIIRDPDVFLFDEPLSNLDAKLRVQMRAELSKLHNDLEATMVYVTHDQVEAMTMGSKIVVMKDGVIQQIGPPLEVYNYPTNKFVAGFIGSPVMNFFPVIIENRNGKLTIDANEFQIPIPENKINAYSTLRGDEFILGVRPNSISKLMTASEPKEQSYLKGVIDIVEPLGSEIHIYVKTGNHSYIAILNTQNNVRVNQEIELVIDFEKIHLFDKKTPNNRIPIDL